MRKTKATSGESLTLLPLAESDLPELSQHLGTKVEELRPMLRVSLMKVHEGRYYEKFAIRAGGMLVGYASLYNHEAGGISEGIEVFQPFRRRGYACWAIGELGKTAREKGYDILKAQVRIGNTASLALHEKLGFCRIRQYVNRRGNEVFDLQKIL